MYRCALAVQLMTLQLIILTVAVRVSYKYCLAVQINEVLYLMNVRMLCIHYWLLPCSLLCSYTVSCVQVQLVFLHCILRVNLFFCH